MGVDNNAILFVGLPVEDVDLLKIPEVTQDRINDVEYACGLPWSMKLNLEAQQLNDDESLIGFKIGDSGSYGYTTFDAEHMITLIEAKRIIFHNIFSEKPLVYLLNYQR